MAQFFFHIRVFIGENSLFGQGVPSVEYLVENNLDIVAYESDSGRVIISLTFPRMIISTRGSVSLGYSPGE